jgi:hypothetical protein
MVVEGVWLAPCFWGNEMAPDFVLGVNNHVKGQQPAQQHRVATAAFDGR